MTFDKWFRCPDSLSQEEFRQMQQEELHKAPVQAEAHTFNQVAIGCIVQVGAISGKKIGRNLLEYWLYDPQTGDSVQATRAVSDTAEVKLLGG